MNYYKPEIECAPRSELEALQSYRLSRTVRRVYENVAPYRKKMDEAGVKPEDIKSIADLQQLPFTVKQALRDNYPYGMFASPMKDIVRIHASSGTTGKQTVVGYTAHDIDMWAECAARALVSVGGTKDDFIHISYGYGLFTGGLGLHYGAEKLGATAIPASAGNSMRQLQMFKDFGSSIICMTPSYAISLIELMKENNISKDEFKLKAGVFGAEPWTEEMRNIIDAQTNPPIAPYAKDGEAILRITAKARDEEEANRLIDPVAAVLKERLGDAVYGEGETDLETVVAEQLLQKQLTLAVAESCTGGMIASNLVEYPGISAALVEGCVTYSNEAKMHRLGVKAETLEKYGAVSEETAKEMAEGIARTSGADIGLATTGVAGPESSEGKPVGLVYIAIAYKGKTEVYTCHFVGKRNKIRERAAYTALNWLRKVINDEA